MKIEDLVIGKEYYLDFTKTCKGIYIGRKSERIGVFFNPTNKNDYLAEPDGSIVFLSAEQNSPVES